MEDEQQIKYPIDATSKSILEDYINTLNARTDKKGVVNLSVAPAEQTLPIAVGDNDGRVLTQSENDVVATLLTATDWYAASSVGTDAYAVTMSPALGAYATGVRIRFNADVANTGAATLEVNSLGAKTIKKKHDIDLATGDIEAGQIVDVVYDGTNFQMQSQLASTSVNVQEFVVDGTWTRPTGALFVEVHCFGGGGGGGYGLASSFDSTNDGAGGGEGGAYAYKRFVADALNATESIVAGTGGTGGDFTTSADATSGEASSFGTNLLVADGGDFGDKGQNGGGAGGTGSGANGDISQAGGDGGNGGNSADGDPGDTTAILISPRGGGGGGACEAQFSGGLGGSFITRYVKAGGIGGVGNGTSGTAGAATDLGFLMGGVGGGGGASYTTVSAGDAGAGGDGGTPGGGGGGGGSKNDADSGDGGDGGAGANGGVVVISYF